MPTIALLSGLCYALVAFLGTAFPLGMPPEKENPVLSHMAPDECAFYTSWAGVAAPDPASSNQTEQLLAEPEVQAFAGVLERTLRTVLFVKTEKIAGKDKANEVATTAMTWIRTILTRPGAFYLTRLTRRDEVFEVEGAFLIHAGEVAMELDRSLTALLINATQTPVDVEIAGRKLHMLRNGGGEAGLVWGVSNGYLMIGVGANQIDGMMARVRSQKEPAWLAAIKANLPVARRSTITYVNVKKIIETFTAQSKPEVQRMIETLGLTQVSSLQAVTGLDDVGMISRSLLAIEGEPRGLLAQLNGQGITAGDLKHIPADALLAAVWTIDVAKSFDNFIAALTEVDPRAAEAARQELNGFGVREAIASLGSHWSLHASLADGGWLTMVLSVEIRDRAQALKAQERLLTQFFPTNGSSGPVGNLIRTPFAGQTIYHISLRDMAVPLVLPSWCLTENRLIVGLNPQAVKSVLLRQGDEKSLAEVPQIADLLKGPNRPLSLAYSDTPKFFEATYSYAQILYPMLSSVARNASLPIRFDAAPLPTQRSISKHVRPSLSVTRRTPRGFEAETRQTLPGVNLAAAAPTGIALLLPAIQAANEASRRQEGSNQLKRIMLAIMNHHDTYQQLPLAYTQTKEGKPLLSWRVTLLPYLGEKQLYDRFHHHEPWDSEHNKPLIAQMPKVFRAPGSEAGPGMTTLMGVGGPRGVIGPPIRPRTNRGFSMSAIVDGTSNTIAVVEGSDALAVEWTKPEEWVPDEKDPFKGLVGLRPNGFLAAFVDGHTAFIPKTVDAQTLTYLFRRDEGKNAKLPVARPRSLLPRVGIPGGLQGMSNLKKQAAVLRQFHEVFQCFPAAYGATRDGQPRLSWRVGLLLFLGEEALFNEFHHNEPWDSEHNRRLIARMPKVYLAPDSKAEAGHTVYLGVGGPTGIFSTPMRQPGVDGEYPTGIPMSRVTDGVSNTIAIVEATDEAAVIWTKPDVWVPEPRDPLKGLIHPQSKGFFALFADGSTRFIPSSTTTEMLNRMFNREDGQPVTLPSSSSPDR